MYKPEFEALCAVVIKDAERVHAFILAPPLNMAQTQRGERELSDWEVSRIAHHYATKLHDPGFGVRLDNSKLSVSEVVAMMLEQLQL